MSKRTESIYASIIYNDYRISGTVVFNDYEGSADVDRGRNWLPPYVQDDFSAVEITGRMHDATEDIDDGMREDMESALIEFAASELEGDHER